MKTNAHTAGFQKVRFYSETPLGRDCTAGLIFTAKEVRELTIADLSRRFPYSEASKMKRIQVSPVLPTWEAAFMHEWEVKCFE